MSRKDVECYCVGSAGAVALKASPAIFSQVKTRLSFQVALTGFGAESLRRWIAWADLLSQDAPSKWWADCVVGKPIWVPAQPSAAPLMEPPPQERCSVAICHRCCFTSLPPPLPLAPLDDRLREVSLLLSSVLSMLSAPVERAPLSFCTCVCPVFSFHFHSPAAPTPLDVLLGGTHVL